MRGKICKIAFVIMNIIFVMFLGFQWITGTPKTDYKMFITFGAIIIANFLLGILRYYGEE